MRTTLVALFASLLFACAADTSDAEDPASTDSGEEALVDDAMHVPAPGSRERAAIVSALHGFIDPAMHHQANELVIGGGLHVHRGWAYTYGSIQGHGGRQLDWRNTDFRARYLAGAFDGPDYVAVLRLHTDGTWHLAQTGTGPAIAVGPTDAPQLAWRDSFVKRGAPADIFR